MAQDQRNVESVAAALHVEAQRLHKTIPEMQSEIHGLMSARVALSSDLEYRVGQVRTLESEMERSSHRARGEAPAQMYNELREQMSARLSRTAGDGG